VFVIGVAAWQGPVVGQLPALDLGGFLAFVIAVVVWIGLGSWGASILTRKNYLAPDSPQIARSSDFVRRVGPRSISPQMVLSFLGPILLITALVLPGKS
jgi:hypothetical protein